MRPRRLLHAACCLLLSLPCLAQDAGHGQTLYNAICRACHGFPPAGGPELTANNPSLILMALSVISQMKPFASQISASDAADISAYIASLQGTGGGMTGGGGGGGGGGNTTPAQPEFDYTDLWYDATESGWGMNIVQHASDNVFAVIYTYDTPNRPMWFVMPGGSWTSSNVFTGILYRVTGSPATHPFKAGAVVQAGTATLTFSGASTGSITYTVNGTRVTKSIEKQPF